MYLVDENYKYKKTATDLQITLEHLDQDNLEQSSMISVIETKIVNMESAIFHKVERTEKWSIEKDVASVKLNEAHARLLELERLFNEKSVESEDLRFQVRLQVGDDDQDLEPLSLIEQLKSKLMGEQQRYKKSQIEMQSLQIRLGQALQDLTRDKRGEEKEMLNKEIMVRNEKIKCLENELENITDNHRSVKRILSEDEEMLKSRTDELENTLTDLSQMYRSLLAKQSSSNIEKQLNIRKITKLNESVTKLENELKEKKDELENAELEANKYLDDMASQSIYNRIRVPIKGGGGKGIRASMVNRLSVKPNRAYTSMVGESQYLNTKIN